MATFDEYIDARATQLGLEPAAFRVLLTEAFGGSRDWRDLRFSPKNADAVLMREDVLRVLDSQIAAKRIAWDGLDVTAVERHCSALRAAATLTSEDRLSHISNTTLRELATTMTPTSGALILGPTGIGKSMAIIEIISRAVRASHAKQRAEQITALAETIELKTPDVKFVSATAISHAMNFGQPNTGTLYSHTHCDWLAIDDLGWDNRAGRDALKYIIARRYDAGLPTVATSGWTLAALEADYGDALIRRIHERAGISGLIVELFGEAA